MRTRLTSCKRSTIERGSLRNGLSRPGRTQIRNYPVPGQSEVIFRILEDDDFRRTEDGNFRILE